jgi:hypothetical protein
MAAIACQTRQFPESILLRGCLACDRTSVTATLTNRRLTRCLRRRLGSSAGHAPRPSLAPPDRLKPVPPPGFADVDTMGRWRSATGLSFASLCHRSLRSRRHAAKAGSAVVRGVNSLYAVVEPRLMRGTAARGSRSTPPRLRSERSHRMSRLRRWRRPARPGPAICRG